MAQPTPTATGVGAPPGLSIATDSLVFAGRLLPRDKLRQELEADYAHNPGHVSCAGDCIRVGSIMNAVWDSFNVVRTMAA